MPSSFWKNSILKMFSVHINHKAGVFKFLEFEQCVRLRSARFLGKLLCTEDLTLETKLCFEIP